MVFIGEIKKGSYNGHKYEAKWINSLAKGYNFIADIKFEDDKRND